MLFNQKNFFSFWYTYSTSKYGNCFTFNTMDNADTDPFVPRQASLTGRDNGRFLNDSFKSKAAKLIYNDNLKNSRNAQFK
jgi:hypothetical protein